MTAYHPRPRRRRSQTPQVDILAEDKAIRFYLASLADSEGNISYSTTRDALYASFHLLKFFHKPITDHAIHDLVQFKKQNPTNTILEESLTIFRTLKPVPSHRQQTALILGIFRRNFARLQMTIHIESNYTTIPIKEGILRAIYADQALTEQHREAIDIMAYGAERIEALTKIPLNLVELVENSAYAVLHIPATLAKTGIAHPSVIPKKLAETLLDRAQKNRYTVLLPNASTLWRHITKLAADKYHVRLTSHYLRKRFESTAEPIPQDKMNCNHWMYLMGSAGKLGHLPDIYGLKFHDKLIKEYDRYLAPRLSLTDDLTEAPIQDDRDKAIQQLTEQVTKLTAVIERLTTKA